MRLSFLLFLGLTVLLAVAFANQVPQKQQQQRQLRRPAYKTLRNLNPNRQKRDIIPSSPNGNPFSSGFAAINPANSAINPALVHGEACGCGCGGTTAAPPAGGGGGTGGGTGGGGYRNGYGYGGYGYNNNGYQGGYGY